jgi:hypothetical protein
MSPSQKKEENGTSKNNKKFIPWRVTVRPNNGSGSIQTKGRPKGRYKRQKGRMGQ